MPEREDRGFQPIGSRVQQIESSLSNADSIQTRQQPNFEITGLARAIAPPNSTGRQLSEIAAGSCVALRRMITTANNPALVDRALRASLTPLVTLSTECEWLTEDPMRVGEIIRFGVSEEIVEGGLAAAAEIVEAALMPMPAQQLVAALARMRALTISRAVESDDLEMTLAAYAEELSAYPADIVRAALRELPRRNKFWPALAEIVEFIETANSERKLIGQALDRARRGNFAERENGPWPSWLENIYGRAPEGPQKRKEAFEAAGIEQ